MISFQGEIKAVQSFRVGRWILIVKPTRSKNSPTLPSRSPLNIGKSLLLFTVLVCGVSLLSFDINSNNILANAQTVAPLAPTFPDNSTGGHTIQIISHQDNQQVLPGELSIQGISSDNEDTDCKVFADVNDNTPMQNVTATGDSGEKDDFSEWTFKYSQGYQLIEEGENELTAKITCLVRDVVNGAVDMKSNGTSMSKWFTVNVTASSKEATAAQ